MKRRFAPRSALFLVAFGLGVGVLLSIAKIRDVPMRVIHTKELAAYDGTDGSKPIYLALDGYVYDVTEGKEFYQVGGPYHLLAGRDASAELHIAGGDIIKHKYPIIGAFRP